MAHNIRVLSPSGVGAGELRRTNIVCLGAAWRRALQDEPPRDLRWLGIVLCAMSAIVTVGSLTFIVSQIG